jgi:hypothetical protein
MRNLSTDPEVRRFIRTSPTPETFTHLAADLRSRFAVDVTPTQAAELWRALMRPRPGRAAVYEKNAALMAFIADRADLMTIDQLLARVRLEFGEVQAPSRTQLHRLVQRTRQTGRSAAEGGNGQAGRLK